MARCCASPAARCTPGSRKPLKASSPRSRRTSRSFWRVTAPEAGLIEKAARLWGKAGQRSLARSALIEAEAQLTRALAQIATLPSTPALRREQIKLQVALADATYADQRICGARNQSSPLSRRALLIEHAEALGEPPEDPLLLFSVLYGFWVTNFVAFNGDVVRELAAQFLALAEKQGATVPLMIGHRLVGDPWWSWAISPKDAPISIARSRSTMPAEHRAADDQIWPGRRVCKCCAFGRWLYGRSAIQRPPERMSSKRSRMRARSATPSRRCMR